MIANRYTEQSAPKWVNEAEVTKIDSGTGEVITKLRREWEKLGAKEGKYAHPDTKKYTMVVPHTCITCQDQIIPAGTPQIPAGSMDVEALEARENEADNAINSYKCPKCDGFAY